MKQDVEIYGLDVDEINKKVESLDFVNLPSFLIAARVPLFKGGFIECILMGETKLSAVLISRDVSFMILGFFVNWDDGHIFNWNHEIIRDTPICQLAETLINPVTNYLDGCR